MHPLGHLHEIVADAQAGEEGGPPAEVVLDGAADPVVADLRARFPTFHADPGAPLERHPAPVPEEPTGLDSVGDAVSLPRDRDLIVAGGPVDRLAEGPVQANTEQAADDANVRGVRALALLRRGCRA